MRTSSLTLRKVTKGLLALLTLFVLSACSNLLVPDAELDRNLGDFEMAWATVQSVYPFFVFKHIDWDSLHSVYRPRAEAARGDEIDRVLYDLLAELRDGHVRLQSRGGASVRTYHPPREVRDRMMFDPVVVRNYCDRPLKVAGDGSVEYEILRAQIGYIRVATLSNFEPVLAGFDEALAYCRERPGIVIDVRHNGGGSDFNSMGIVGRLIAAPVDNLPYPIPGGGVQPGGQIPPRGPFTYAGPVVLLVNGVCFSSCEDLAEMLKHLPTVTLLGDTTAGGSGAPHLFPLPSGRQINVSTKDIRRYDGEPIEWNGVPPTVRVANSVDDLRQGRDRQLEQAIRLLQPSSPLRHSPSAGSINNP